jgi:malonyl CoA-acyl carrier protein transacylase
MRLHEKQIRELVDLLEQEHEYHVMAVGHSYGLLSAEARRNHKQQDCYICKAIDDARRALDQGEASDER